MLAPARRWWTFACCVLASLALAGLSAAPAALAARAVAHATGTANHSNVGATHSPQLLSQLAGPAAGMAKAGPGRTAAPVITGAEQGVDVAAYQHPGGAAISWSRVRASGIGFAGVKASEGAYYRNPYGRADLAQTRAAGLAVAAYAFGIPNGNGGSRNAVTQADYLLRYLGTQGRTVPVALDIEYNPYGRECYGLSARAMVSWVSSFSAEIKAKTSRPPVIYTPPAWWATCTGSSTESGHSTRLWVPDYTTSASPRLPAGWKTWSIWQFSSSGTVRGIRDAGYTDLDQANPAVPPALGTAAGAAG